MTDRGSTLLLFPSCLLVVIVLASITVDFGRVHLAQQEVQDAAAAAANDAVTVALDDGVLRTSGAYVLDPGLVRQVVEDDVARHHLVGFGTVAIDSRVVGARGVEVDVGVSVPLGFAAIVPGAPPTVAVVGRARADAVLR